MLHGTLLVLTQTTLWERYLSAHAPSVAAVLGVARAAVSHARAGGCSGSESIGGAFDLRLVLVDGGVHVDAAALVVAVVRTVASTAGWA